MRCLAWLMSVPHKDARFNELSLSEGLEGLSMSLVCPYMLEAEGSSVENVYECSEDMMRLPRVVILSIPFQ